MYEINEIKSPAHTPSLIRSNFFAPKFCPVNAETVNPAVIEGSINRLRYFVHTEYAEV